MATSISIKGKTTTNETTTATVNYVNPNATNAQLISLAEALNGLTTNTISDVTKISKESLTDATQKLERNLTISPTSINYSSIASNADSPTVATLTFDGDGTPTTKENLQNVEGTTSEGRIYITTRYINNAWSLGLIKNLGDRKAYGTITISLPETDTYQAATAELTITT